MHASLARLMHGVIDYAGLYPPAKLSMRDAVQQYLNHRSGPEAWIVSRFICPSNKLMEFEQELSRNDTECVPLAVIGSGGKTIEDFESNLENDVADMNRFEDAVGDACEIEAFEVRAPSAKDIEQVIHDLEGFGDIDVFVELPWASDMHDGLVALAESEWLGVKARAGGADASFYPSSAELAGLIRDCLNLDLPFKLTAGLHHPIRRRNNALNVDEHGFLNVLCATAMAESHDLSTGEIERALNETDGGNFAFGESGFGWHDFGASLDDIESIRSLLTSFGSCSVDEPWQDLRSMSLL